MKESDEEDKKTQRKKYRNKKRYPSQFIKQRKIKIAQYRNQRNMQSQTAENSENKEGIVSNSSANSFQNNEESGF